MIFLHLFKSEDCNIQLGGSDQWGNILAGLDLVKKSSADPENDVAFGITIPLLTTPTGEKFGKSEGNAVWLDATMLPSFEFYQVILFKS
jgi:tyrosyl-tRNA synthetase